jgi:osmotically-inducible protein OsmY
MEGSGGFAYEMWRADGDGNGLSSELQNEVWDELRWEPELENCCDRLLVAVSGSRVTLSGIVQRYLHKAVAERAACRVPGVVDVTNRIQVDLNAADARSDASIAEEVQRVLEWDTLVPHDRIEVAVRDGVVRLSGQVDREHQRTAAEQAVEPLVGLTNLINWITVRQMLVTGELRPQVVAAIQRVRSKHVHVETHGGVVELRGRVRSIAERNQIEHLVRGIPGVTSVEDELRVER